jgi:hypothetical protein
VSPIIERRRPSCCHSRAYCCGPSAASWRSRAASWWLIGSGAPLHRLRHCQGFIGDHRLQPDARALLGGGDVVASPSPSAVNTSRASFSRCRPPSAGSRRRFAHTSDAASLNVCLPIPASLIDKDPHSLRLSGWPSGHLLRCSLNGVFPQTQRIPCLTGLNPRALDPQIGGPGYAACLSVRAR